MSSFTVFTEQFEKETEIAHNDSGKIDPKKFPHLELTGRSISLRWSDFVVRVSGGQRPIFAVSNATIVYLEAKTADGPIVQIIFSSDPQGEFFTRGSSLKIFTENRERGVLDEWELDPLPDTQFCYPAKPPITKQRQLGPIGDLNYFDKISMARIVVPALNWESCLNVRP